MFDWNVYYGKGFDVLYMSNVLRFFVSRDVFINGCILFMFVEYGIGYVKGSMMVFKICNLDDDQLEVVLVKFVDFDVVKFVVQGDMVIMFYFYRCYGLLKDVKDEKVLKFDMVRKFILFQKVFIFFMRWCCVQFVNLGKVLDFKFFKEEFLFWDKIVIFVLFDKDDERKGGFLSGGIVVLGFIDFVLWFVVNDVV